MIPLISYLLCALHLPCAITIGGSEHILHLLQAPNKCAQYRNKRFKLDTVKRTVPLLIMRSAQYYHVTSETRRSVLRTPIHNMSSTIFSHYHTNNGKLHLFTGLILTYGTTWNPYDKQAIHPLRTTKRDHNRAGAQNFYSCEKRQSI
jgi:hypothetical protein